VQVEASVALLASPDRAWAFALRWEDQPRWIRDAVWVRVVSPEREGVGARIEVRNRVLHVSMFTEQLEVTAWDPPRRLEMTHRGFVRGVGTWWFEPDASGTRFTWTEELSLPVPILGELALWVYRPFMKQLMRSGLANLQRLIEST
jgi:Polyketide cyclase / dehydrase and lipid transport